MKLDIKYSFGDEVYVVFKENDGLIRVFKDKVQEISMSEKYGLHYYVNKLCEEFKEEELVSINDKNLLIARIDELSEVENERTN